MRIIFSFLIAVLFLTACGGGSGNSSSSSTGEPIKAGQLPSIKLSKSVLYLQATENGTALTFKEEISFEIENQKETVYVATKNNNPELIERVYLPLTSINNPVSKLTLYVAQPFLTALKKGTYQGSVTLMLCEDNQCVKQIPGSMQTISIVYDVF